MSATIQPKGIKNTKGDSPFRTTAAGRVPLHGSAIEAPKALRIGIIQNGRIVEEKIVRERESVTVGFLEKNTFVVPSPLLPARHVLFEVKGGRHVLNTVRGMKGKVQTGRGVRELADIEGGRRIDLDDSSRGKIVIGDATLLFQFVAAPPLQPRPQLPASVRGGWLRNFGVDRVFSSIVFFSLVMHVAPLIFLVLMDWPIDVQGFDLDNKYIQLVLLPPDESVMKALADDVAAADDGDKTAADDDADDAVRDDAKPTKTPAKPGKILSAEEKAAIDAQRRAKLEATVSSKGILAVIGTESDGANGNAGIDLLAPGGVDSDMDAVLQSVTGTKLASAEDAGSSLRTLADSAGGSVVADISALDISHADAELETEHAKETGVKAKASLGKGEEVDGSGILDPAEVTKVVRSRMTAIQMCYQKGLNKNYGLEGKISVRFTIGTSGRVTKAVAVEDTLDDPDVAACVIDKVKGFAFTEPEGGAVEYVFPFVFKPAN
jgi:hypothetical protein